MSEPQISQLPVFLFTD